MTVNIGGGGHLGVSQAAGDNHKGRTVCNHQAGACVSNSWNSISDFYCTIS